MSKLQQWSVKYRPTSIEDIIAPESVKNQITQIVTRRNVHAVLISGSTGSGKTTLGRILAYQLAGYKYGTSSQDLLEVNCGSKGSKEDVEGYIKASTFLPSKKDGKRVFLLDEAHKLSGAAASALLKPLEEPQSHVVWILITDQPERLLETMQNRCISIRMPKPTQDDLVPYLMGVLKKEKAFKSVSTKDKTRLCKAVCEAGDYVPRACLQLLNSASMLKEENYPSIKDMISGYIMASPEVDLSKAAARIMIAYLLAATGKDVYKALVSTIRGVDPTMMLNRLMYLSQSLVIEYASGSQVNGTYIFNKAVKEKELEVDPRVCEIVFSNVVEARSKLATFSAPPEAVLLKMIVDTYRQILRGKK